MGELANIPLDVQITICIFLHPSDILALRKTCKALELITRRRVVWMAALHRVCLDNALFLPSFPIPDMSDLELEKAAMAPRRWIGLCGALKKHPIDPGTILWPRTTRIIEQVSSSYVFIVPGGRYLVNARSDGLFVWDLGYFSNADCKLIASVILEADFELCMVQATSDDMGLIILLPDPTGHVSVFEIFPQSETPLLTQIAHLYWHPSEDPIHLLPDIMIFCRMFEDRIVFRVLDYRVNHSTSFVADVDINILKYSLETFATKTAIFIFCREGILIWAIPPLSPQSSDHFLNDNAKYIPPLFKIPFPDDIVYYSVEFFWKTISSWYCGSLESIYFDISHRDLRHHRFKIIAKLDLSDASLHLINTSELTPHNFQRVSFQRYRICEDTLVSCWRDAYNRRCGAYTGLTSVNFTNFTEWGEHSHSLCPASGRFVYFACDDDNDDDKNDGRIVVVDLF